MILNAMCTRKSEGLVTLVVFHFLLLLIKLSVIFNRGILVLLVLRHKISHVGLSLSREGRERERRLELQAIKY